MTLIMILGGCTSTHSPRKQDVPPNWVPKPADTWQFQYAGKIDLSVPADVFDLDYQETTKAQIQELHRRGRRAVCYIDAGTWESFRPDAYMYHQKILGNAVDGWPDERWLDIRDLDQSRGKTGLTLRELIVRKIKICAQKGFDGVDPDWQHAYTESTGFHITATQQLSFNKFLAREAHKRGMAAGLKNDKEQAKAMVKYVDFGVDEECQQWSECEGAGTKGDPGWAPFIDADKAVAGIEYSDYSMKCARIVGISTILKHRNLDAWLVRCPAG